MHRYVLLAVVPFVALALTLRAQDDGEPRPPVTPDGPRVKWKEKELDFGQVVQGEKVHRSFAFTNPGKQKLVIQKVEPSCGCTIGRIAKEAVAPGEDGEIELIFDSADRVGYQNLRITVYTNDPTQNDHGPFASNLTLRGEVRSLYKVMPTGAYFGSFVRSLGSRKLEIRLQGQDEASHFKVLKVSTSVDWITADVAGADGSYVVTVGLLPHAPVGPVDPLGAIITVETDAKRQPRIRMPVIVVVSDDVRGPEFVHMGRVARSAGKEQIQSLERADGRSGLRLLGVDYDHTRLEIEHESVIEGARIDLRIRLKKDAPPGPFASMIRAHLDEPGTPVVEFPIFGEVVPRVVADPVVLYARGPLAKDAVLGRTALTLDRVAASSLKAVKIEPATAPLTATLDRDARTRPNVTVTATGPIQGPLDASLVIETDVAGEERVLVPLRVEGKSK